jgi:hypothetical protein
LANPLLKKRHILIEKQGKNRRRRPKKEKRSRSIVSLQLAAEPPPLVPRETGLFRTRDETPIYYEVHGHGRPLILCYGLLCRREHWRYQIEPLARHYTVILFDYRGHHRSGAPANDQHLTLDWCARDVQDLIAGPDGSPRSQGSGLPGA